MVSSLILLLVSCSATGPTTRAPIGPRELARYVLIIQETPTGDVRADWKPLKDFDLTKYPYPFNMTRLDSQFQRTSAPMDDDQIGDVCELVWSRCMDRCMGSPLPPHASHYISSRKSLRAALGAYCTDECARERDSCRKELERKAREATEFSTADDAVDWLKRHKEEIAVGALVVIAGVAFCAVVGSGGLLVLAPVLIFASPDAAAVSPFAEAAR